MRQIRSWLMGNEVLAFFLLTFLISWGTWIPLARVFYEEDAFIAVVPMSWGIFGPALAGILITRMNHPQQKVEGRRKGFLAFFMAWVLTGLIWILFTFNQAGVPRTSETILVITLMGSLIALAPAYVVSSAFSSHLRTKAYLQSLIKPRGALIYYLIALLAPPSMYWIGSLISNTLGQAFYWSPPPLAGWTGARILVLTFFYQFCFGNVLGEEVGWRGFALPRLQARYSPLVASLIIAPFWFAWHVPLKLANPDVIPYLFYGLSFIPSTIFLTWIFNRTKGSILAVGLAHVTSNLGGKLFFPITPGKLVAQSFLAVMLIIIDRMWVRSDPERPSYAPGTQAERSPASLYQPD